MKVPASTPLHTGNAAYLLANNQSYEWLVSKIKSIYGSKNKEEVLRQVENAASFAGRFHTGRFADGAIENVALEIGAELDNYEGGNGIFDFPTVRTGRRRVLHVTSEVLGIGGHTRMIYQWVLNDRSSCHLLVLMDQGRDVPVPQWLAQAIKSSGGNIMILPSGSKILQKAQWLRYVAKQGADLVVLHHGFCDVVPTMAFASRDCPPVAVLNHADHLFWLGSSVSDIVINLRTAGAEHTKDRRYISNNTVIPIPLEDNFTKQVSRHDARRTLGIGEKEIMLLSIGRDLKYRPCDSYDFVATANKILNTHPDTHLYVIGETVAGITPFLNCKIHERFHFLGSMEDPSLYRAAADIYLESFPFGSQTALLESALCGLSMVPAYAPLFPLLVANDDSIQDILLNPRNEQEYVERVGMLINNPKKRELMGAELRERLLIDHVGEGWLSRLAELYHKTDSLKHEPRHIPESTCELTDADIGLSLWNVIENGKTRSTKASEDRMGSLLNHTAFVAKEVEDYRKARRVAWRAVRHNPFRLAVLRLFAVVLLGRTGKFIRRLQYRV